MSLECEKTLLASVLNGASDWFRVALDHGLQSDHFGSPEHKLIWEAILEVEAKRKAIRYAAVEGVCLRRSRELAETCKALHALQRSFQAAEFYVESIIADHAVLKAQEAAVEMTGLLKGKGDLHGIREVLRTVSTKIDSLANNLEARTRDNSFHAVHERAYSALEKKYELKDKGIHSHIKSGLPPLDELLGGGWQKPGNHVICAISGRGKTHIGVSLFLTAGLLGAHGVYFTVEMPQSQIMHRAMAHLAGIDAKRITSLEMTADEIVALGHLPKSKPLPNLAIEDDFNAEFEKLAALVRRYKRAGRLDFVVVDYVQQLVSGTKRFHTKQQEMFYITHALKQLCIHEDIVMIQLAQTNRDAERAEKSGEKMSAGHIEHSHAIYENADAVMFFQVQGAEHLLFVAKNRHGKDQEPIPVRLNYAQSRLEAL